MMKEKRIDIAGFRFGLATEEQTLERLKRNPLVRYIVKPSLDLVKGKNGRNGDAKPRMHPVDDSTLPPAPDLSDPKVKEIWDRVSKIGWYHTIDLGNGIVTPGFIDNRPTMHRFGLPEDMTGLRCLDIGTYDGFWAFEFERRGASEVIAIDVDSPAEYDVPRLHRQKILEEANLKDDELRSHWDEKGAHVGIQFPGDGFRLAKEILNSKVERKALNVYDLSPEKVGKFDVILISQLLLRLRDPQTVFENMFSVCKGIAVVGEPYEPDLEADGRPLSTFIGTSVLGVWWGHSIQSMKRMMEVAGFEPVEEVSRFEATNRAGRFSKVILKGYAPGETGAAGSSQATASRSR